MTSTKNMNQVITAAMDDYHDRQHIDQQQQQHYQQQQQHEQSACKTDNNIKQDEKITSNNDDDEHQQYLQTTVKNVGPYDVICGRGSVAFNNIGNRRFRILIGLNVDQYSAADGRHRKIRFIGSLVHTFMHSLGAKFYKMKKGQLTELMETQIRKKVGHALRDTLAFQESQEKNHQQSKNNKTTTKTVSNTTTSTKEEPITAPIATSWSSVAVVSSIRSHLNRSNTNSSNSNNHVASTVTIPKHLSCPPPHVPHMSHVVFFNPIFQQEPSLNKFDYPSSPPQGGGGRCRRETRVSILEAKDFSSHKINAGTHPLRLGGDSSFPVSVNEQHQQLRQQQQQQQQQRRSLSATSTASSTGQVIHKSLSVIDKKLFDLKAADRKQDKREFEEWLLWNENTNNDNNNNNNTNNNKDSFEIIDYEKITEDDIDPFNVIDFIPIPIENVVHQDQDQDQQQDQLN